MEYSRTIYRAVPEINKDKPGIPAVEIVSQWALQLFQYCHFFFRNQETKRDDFVFFTNRLACLIIEYALSFPSFKVSYTLCVHMALYKGK